MLIKPSSENDLTDKSDFFRKNNAGKIILVSVFVFLLVGVALFFSNNFIKTKSYSNIFDFTYSCTSNYLKSIGADPEKIDIEITADDFKKLEAKRKKAFERNLIINEEGSYVPAIIKHKKKKIKVMLRLKGHMTDHLEGKKWSYRVKVKGKEHLMGLRKFSLQHPGTRGYIYEWIYHRLLYLENVISLRYQFIDVTLNGEDLGIYAVEEHFDEELIEYNNRLKGPVFRFNPNLYWIDRYNEILGDRVTHEFATYSSSDFEAFKENKTLSDSVQHLYFLKGMALIEAFRRGELPTDSVFDIEKQARFYAIMDLLGGHFSMDWSDIKFYYNPVISKLEPIGYESCSLFPAKRLAGSYQYRYDDKEDFHQNLFSDLEFFKEYIHQLEKVTEKEYLDDFFATIDKELNENLKILYTEFPYKKFDKELYYKNQNSIKKMLDTPKGLHAFYNGYSGDSLFLQVGVIESLPIEITGILLNDSLITKPFRELVLPAKMKETPVKYEEFGFCLSKNFVENDALKNLSIEYRIPGASNVKKAEIYPYPYKDKIWLKTDILHHASNVDNFSFLVVNDSTKIIYIKPGKWKVDKNILIPKGYIVRASGSTTLNLTNTSQIISYSALEFIGQEESPVIIYSSDSTGIGVAVLNAEKKSKFEFVRFSNFYNSKTDNLKLNGAATFYESDISMINCYFSGGGREDGVSIISSYFYLDNCIFENLQNDALDIKFSNGEVNNSSFVNCKEDAVDVTGGSTSLKNISASRIGNKAFNIKAHTDFKITNVEIKFSNIGVSAEDLANVKIHKINISDTNVGFMAYCNKSHFGPASIVANEVKINNNKQDYLLEKKASLIINGSIITSEVKNIEKFTKQKQKEDE